MTNKTLLITGCSDGMMWYAKRIGQMAEMLGEGTDTKGSFYWSREPGGYKNIILKQDAQIVEAKEHNGSIV